jgi:ABC-type transport system involved in cytochrome bd biosynthesis fused ATPase/permease subunit
MGAFDDVAPILLPDPSDPEAASAFRAKWGWEPHEQVILSGTYSAADMEAVTNASVQADPGKSTTMKFQGGAGRIELLHRLIKDWTFTRGGVKVSVSMHSIRQLPANYMTPILQKCDELARTTLTTEEEQQDFLTAANGHISDTSELMNLSQMKS